MPLINTSLGAAKGEGAHDSPMLGIAAAIAAFFTLNLMSLFAKLLSENHHIAEIAFWRNSLAFLPFLVLAFVFGRRELMKIHSRPRVMVARSVIGSLNMLLVFGAFALLPMADATALIFTSALFSPVLGFLLLGERVGPYRWSAVVIGFLGVLVVAQPSGEGNWSALGVALGLGGAFVNSLLGMMLRVLGQSESPQTMTFYFLAIGTVLLAPAVPLVGTMPQADEIWILAGLGVTGIAMPMFIASAFKYAPAALVSPFNYTQILWATLFGWMIFGDLPSVNMLVGSAIIIASSVIVILREHYLARKGRLRRTASDGSGHGE